MAKREVVYAKFGMTAEAGQLFETELGTLLLGVKALEHDWHMRAAPVEARRVLRQIEAHTLGRLLGALRNKVSFDDGTLDCFVAALATRNRLNHGFYERHNFKMQTDEGRDAMMADLEQMHAELFDAWQRASKIADATVELFGELRRKTAE